MASEILLLIFTALSVAFVGWAIVCLTANFRRLLSPKVPCLVVAVGRGLL